MRFRDNDLCVHTDFWHHVEFVYSAVFARWVTNRHRIICFKPSCHSDKRSFPSSLSSIHPSAPPLPKVEPGLTMSALLVESLNLSPSQVWSLIMPLAAMAARRTSESSLASRPKAPAAAREPSVALAKQADAASALKETEAQKRPIGESERNAARLTNG